MFVVYERSRMMYEEGEGERKANVNQEKSRLGGGYIIEPSPAAHETLYVTVHSVQCSDNNETLPYYKL